MFRSGEEGSARVLIASPDTALRSALMSVLGSAHRVTVVGFIRTESQVVSRTTLSAPDLLLLDARLGTDAQGEQLAALWKSLPKLRVVVYGIDLLTANQRRSYGEGTLLDERIHGVRSGEHDGYRELQAALAGLFACHRPAVQRTSGNAASAKPASGHTAKRKPHALVIASSTGGPFALTTLFKMLPGDFPLPVAVVQHMPPGFTRMLANRLNDTCALEAVEGEAGMALEPGRIIIGPGDYHMVLRGNAGACRVALHQGEREHSCRPAANVLFRSAADVYGGNVLTLVLTGMGRDGFEGARQLHELGARVVVQDAATSTVWGMPGAIAQAGFADAILPLQDIAGELTRCL